MSGIGRRTAIIFSVASGVAVANVYYLQPIMAIIAVALHAGPQTVGLVAFAQQAGYAAGILFFVPLGDILERRTLIVALCGVAALALAGAALAPTIGLLALALCVLGLSTSVPQVLQPFAADLALPGERARVVGIILTGVIVGTLCARLISGMLGAYAGWRAVFAFAAVVTALSTLVLARVVPLRASQTRLRYGQLLATLPGLVRAYPLLRASMLIGALLFAVFIGFWTVLAFHVRDIGYGSEVVGYLSLVSIAGALVAGTVGRLTDRFGTFATSTFGWCAAVAAFAVLLTFGNTLAGLFAGMTLFALSTQSTQVANQARIFALDDAARSRLNTIYMFAMYLGGAWGSFACAWAFAVAGWSGACILCLAHLAVMGAALLWLRGLRMRAPAVA